MLPMHEITELLKAWSDGDEQAMDKLMPLVDRELKKIARSYMRKEKVGHILQTTALINEALMRLIREHVSWDNRNHFYGIVAKRMRQVLVDYARKQSTVKRGKYLEQVDIGEARDEISEKSNEVIRLEDALTELSRIDERKVTIIECRFFTGLSLDEIAKLLGISPATVQREWSFARTWLKRRMKEGR
jgi:RNA polymerase sigma-70 factor, ECF subfamily